MATSMGLVDKNQERNFFRFFSLSVNIFLKMQMVCLLDVVGYGAYQCWFRKGKMFNHWPNFMSGEGIYPGHTLDTSSNRNWLEKIDLWWHSVPDLWNCQPLFGPRVPSSLSQLTDKGKGGHWMILTIMMIMIIMRKRIQKLMLM